MTKELLAARLTGRGIGEEIAAVEEQQAKKAGLVVVFGASDDLMEFRGAISDEIGAWNGAQAQIDKEGLLPERDSIDDDDELEKYFARKRGRLKSIDALWCKEPNYSWTFKTDIPHATFEIVEDGEPYCRGIVFALTDV